MIRLSSVQIHNYRGIPSLSLDISTDPDRTVHPIIGLNESGKTTVLEAITFVSSLDEDLSSLEIAGLRRWTNYDLIPIAKKSSFSGNISVELGFTIDDTSKEAIKKDFERQSGYTLTTFPSVFGIKQVVTFVETKETKDQGTYTFIPQYAKLKSRQAKPDSNALWPILRSCIATRLPSVLYVPNFLFDIPQEIELKKSQELDAKQNFFHKLLDGLLKTQNSQLSFTRHIVERSLDTSEEARRAMRATVAQLEHLLQVHVIQNWQDVFGHDLSSLTVKISINTKTDHSTLEITVQQDGNEYRLGDRSLGFRWFFSFLMLTFFGRSLGINRQSVFLLDEPASNLHAAAQVRLLRCFGSQKHSLFIYSTHSHYLLSPELLPSTFVAMNKGYDQARDDLYVAAKTNISVKPFRTFVSEHPDQTEHFRVALDVLDVPTTGLEISYPCVFVEGKSDWYYCRLAQQAGVLSSSVVIYPCGGVNTLDARIQVAIGRNEPFALLVDGDSAGDGIVSKLSERYGEIFRQRSLTLKDCKRSLTTSEDLFSDTMKKRIVEKAGLRGTSKAVFRRAAELVVAGNSSIDLDAATRKNFEAVDRGVQGRLSVSAA